jgi:hypothetical protein
MLLWVSIFGGVALIVGTAWLALSMGRAERRARRNLYRSLGLAEATVEYLMARNRDVLSELTYVRHRGEAAVVTAIEASAALDRKLSARRAGFDPDRPAPAPPLGRDRIIPPADEHPPSSDGHTRH